MKYHDGANAEYSAGNYSQGFGSRAELGWIGTDGFEAVDCAIGARHGSACGTGHELVLSSGSGIGGGSHRRRHGMVSVVLLPIPTITSRKPVCVSQ